MDYADFELRIEPGKGGRHRVLVLSSPAGETSGPLLLPFVQKTPRRPARRPRKRHISLDSSESFGDLEAVVGPQVHVIALEDLDFSESSGDLEVTGSTLFQALFSGPVLQLYQRSLEIVRAGGPERGLRIRLHVDPERPGLKQICRLSWELLYEPDQGFLGLNPRRLISRYLAVPLPPTPVRLDDPLRVLVVLALPENAGFLDLRMELRWLESAWRGVDGVDLRVLEGATRDSLQKALDEELCHVLHFMGHGEIVGGQGTLVLEGGGRGEDFLSGSELAGLMARRQLPALVVLNACQTAESSHAADAFGGVAGTLVKAGILSVVAMQAPISDNAALAFSKELYRRLSAGDLVDAAVTAGRRAIEALPGSSAEWFIPVLFLRSRDGKIFDPVRVPLRERETARRLARALSSWQREQFLAELDPGGTMEPGAEEDVCETAALRGGEDWLHCCEVLLALRSPVYPFDGKSLREWSPRPRRIWQIYGETLTGLGDDSGAVSALTWEGLRFRDGSVEARVEVPLLAMGGAAGLALRWTGRAVVHGLLRGDPGTGEVFAEIVQRRGGGLFTLRSVPVAFPEEPFDIRLAVAGRRATLHVRGEVIAADLETDPVPGYAGLVKFGGALAYFRRPAVAVTNHVSGLIRRPL